MFTPAISALLLEAVMFGCPSGVMFPGDGLAPGANGLMAVADLTGDGTLDFIRNGPGYREITVYLHDEGVETHHAVPTEYLPIAAIPVDLGGSPDLDLIVYYQGTHCISILPGMGNGVFGPGECLDVSGNPRSLRIADLNGDGQPDIVVGFFTSTGAAWRGAFLFSNGDGTLDRTRHLLPGSPARLIILHDFSEDGLPEAVFQEEDRLVRYHCNDRGYPTRSDFVTLEPDPTRGVLMVDVNEDGNLDIVFFRRNGLGYFRPGLRWFRFGGPIDFPVGFSLPRSGSDWADLDGDGDPDLLLSRSGRFEVRVGQPGFSFADPVITPYPGPVGRKLKADWNGDGLLDLVLANGQTGRIEILPGLTPLSWKSRVQLVHQTSYSLQEVVARDFDADGNKDIAMLESCYSCARPGDPPAGRLTLFRGTGLGGYEQVWSESGGLYSVMCGLEIDHDDFPDLVVLTTLGLTLRRGREVGFGPPQALGATSLVRPLGVDPNSDGWDDLVFAGSPAGIAIMPNDGRGNLLAPRSRPTAGGVVDLASGDLNGDGLPDVAACVPDANLVQILPGVDSEDALGLPEINLAVSHPTACLVNDLDGDGRDDLVVSSDEEGKVFLYRGWLGSAAPTPLVLDLGGRPTGLDRADFNGDGVLDLAVLDSEANEIILALGDGDGGFQRSTQVPGPLNSRSGYRGRDPFFAGDLNGDGDPDLAVSRSDHGGLAFYVNACSDPTPVILSSFEAIPEPEGILLRWTTTGESDHAGFLLHRSREPRGEYVPVTPDLVPPPSPYSFLDADVIPDATYSYRLEAVGRTGARELFGPISVRAAGRIGTVLAQSHPNPASGSTTMIPFSLDHAGEVRVRILDLAGKQVRLLVDAWLSAGPHDVVWDGRNDRGSILSSGIYFYVLEGPGGRTARKMVKTR